MYCPICGAGLPEDARFCAVCGASIVKPSETDAGSSESIHEESLSTLKTGRSDAVPGTPASAAEQSTAVRGTPASSTEPSAAVPGTPVPESSIPASVAAPANSDTPSAPKNGSNILLIAGVALGLIVLGIVAFTVIRNFVPSNGNSRLAYMQIPLIIDGEDEVQIYNGGSKPVTIDGSYARSVYSMDGKKSAIGVDSDDMGACTLYYYNGTEVKEVSDDVYSFEISANGNAIAYLTDSDRDNYGITYTFNVYDASADKSKKVTDEVSDSILLSPDGKSYAYTSDIEFDDYGIIVSSASYVSVNGKEAEPLDSNMRVIGMSNSANYLYYVELGNYSDTEGKLYVRHGKTETKLGKVDINYNVFYNQDYSEILYTNNYNTYLSRTAGDKEKIASNPIYLLCPNKLQKKYIGSIVSGYVFNLKSLTGQSYYGFNINSTSSEMMIGYLDSKGKFTETDTIDYDNSYDWEMASNCKGFYCLNDSGEIQYYKNMTDPETKPVKIEGNEDITYFVVSKDQSTVYFTDADETLWVKRGNSEAVKVADDVSQIVLSADGKGLYLIADYSVNHDYNVNEGTLCYISNARNAKASEIAEDVSSVDVSDFGVVYYVFDEMRDDSAGYVGEAYYSRDGKNFKSVMDDAYFW